MKQADLQLKEENEILIKKGTETLNAQESTVSSTLNP
jgi:hypothetical protein